jgi:hypothetical protein
LKHSKKIALFFSMIPGAGHMYLGLVRQGIQLMLLFFLTFSIIASVNLDVFAALLPIIWFYSIFDVRLKVTSDEPLVDSDLKIFSSITSQEGFIKKNTTYKYIGYGFILIGVAALINNFVFPLINDYIGYQFIRFIRHAFNSLILIIIGLSFLRSKPNLYSKKGNESLCKDEE